MKVLSNPTVYAIRALIYMVSQQPDRKYVSIRSIAEKLDISFHLLTKTFQQLTAARMLTSYRGPGGGIALSRPANEIYLIEVVHVLEGENFFDSCLLGLPGCGEMEPCPMHQYWSIAKEDLREKFKNTSLAKLNDLGARIGAAG